MHPVGWVHTPGWLSFHHTHREEKHIYCYWHVERNLHMFCMWVDSQLEIITWEGVMMLLSLIYHYLKKINQSYKQAAFVLLNTHFVMILKKLLHCRSLNRLSKHPFLTSEVARGEIHFVLLWGLSVSSCYSWLARWAGVSSLSVCILGGCGDCRLCCFSFISLSVEIKPLQNKNMSDGCWFGCIYSIFTVCTAIFLFLLCGN